MFKILLLLVCVMFTYTLGYPQSIQENIDSVFGTQDPNPPTRRPASNRGAGVIVTPEPIVNPTQSPQTFVTNGQQCLCVPYYNCDPTNQTVVDSNNVVDGFGIIDIRFDPQSCQDVLDVCCQTDKQTEEPIVPVPIEQKPGRASGCGIRNVGGIDFELAGNYVSDLPYKIALTTRAKHFFLIKTISQSV